MSFNIFESFSKNINDILADISTHKLIKIKNHDIKTKQDLIHFSEKLGELLKWDFGYINELKIDSSKNNYLYSNQKVPFHWDGAFHKSPYLLIFHCLKAPKKEDGGQTLFTNSNAIYNSLNDLDIANLKKITLEYQTSKVAHYGGNIKVKPLAKHPYSNENIIRFAEEVSTQLNPVSLKISGLNTKLQQQYKSLMIKKIYDCEYCYQHDWQDNELIIADNFSLLHGRLKFNNNSKRHIRRVQILELCN